MRNYYDAEERQRIVFRQIWQHSKTIFVIMIIVGGVTSVVDEKSLQTVPSFIINVRKYTFKYLIKQPIPSAACRDFSTNSQ